MLKKLNEQGMALMIALLYLLVISLLVVSAFSTGLLQTKMSQHFSQETLAFEDAESALRVGESTITVDQETGVGQVSKHASYNFTKIARPECGLYYQVDAVAAVAAAKRHLQSMWVIPHAGANPCAIFDIPHRIIWRELE